jgi:hypothetical protein
VAVARTIRVRLDDDRVEVVEVRNSLLVQAERKFKGQMEEHSFEVSLWLVWKALAPGVPFDEAWMDTVEILPREAAPDDTDDDGAVVPLVAEPSPDA